MLDINFLIRNRWRSGGILSWSSRGKPVGSIGYNLNLADSYVRLLYRWRESERLDYEIPLTNMDRYFGGVQYFFLCPECGKRAMKLCKPPASKYFHCRTCQNLTYRSCRESHKYDKLFARWAAEWKLPVQAFKNVLKQ